MEIYDQNPIDFGMNPEITSVKDAEDIHNTMVALEFKMAIGDLYAMPHYRGEHFYGWNLSPNLYRIDSVKADKVKARQAEKNGIDEFEKVIKANFGDTALRKLFDNEKHGKEWDMLFQAQHAGVKTSLLDWSPNVYAPLYFAVEKSNNADTEKADGQFWVYMVPFDKIKSHNEFPVKDTFYNRDPFTLDQGCMINVSIYLDDLKDRKYETRMFHQKGRFYLSGSNEVDIAMNSQPEVAKFLFRFRIPTAAKAGIRQELLERGINDEYLYGPANPAHQALIDSINKSIFS